MRGSGTALLQCHPVQTAGKQAAQNRGNVNCHRRAIYQNVNGPANKKPIRELGPHNGGNANAGLVEPAEGDAGMVVAHAGSQTTSQAPGFLRTVAAGRNRSGKPQTA